MPGHLSNHFSNTTLSKVPPMMVPLSLFKMFIGVIVSSQCMLVSAVQQSESALHIHVSPLFLCFLPIQVTTKCWVEFPELYSRFSFVIYFIRSSVCMSIPISQFIPPASFLPLCPITCSLSLCLNFCFGNSFVCIIFQGFPCDSAGKESTCNAGDLGLIPGLGRSPGEGKGYPLHYSGLENSMDCIVHEVTKSWTRLSNLHFHYQVPFF